MSDKTEYLETATSVEGLSMHYVLLQIEKISAQNEYLFQVIQQLGAMSDGDNADGMSPGNTLGQAKAAALGDIVRCRETTNQQILKLYEKMYDDLKPKTETLKDKAIQLADRTLNNATLTPEEKEGLQTILDEIRHIDE